MATTALTGIAGIGAAAAMAMAFVQPAQAQTFQDGIDTIGGLCGGSFGPGCPFLGTAGGPGGQVEVQGGGQPPGIEQRMRELQCKAEGNASCLQPGGAAADSMPFEGLNLFVSTDYQKKIKDEAAEAGLDSDRGASPSGSTAR